LYIYIHTYIYKYRSRELGDIRDTRLEVEALPGKAEGMAFEFDRVFGPQSSQAFFFVEKKVIYLYVYGKRERF
jgi:hypothetical protein